MRYGSVCSGIEAASVAWHPLGFEPAWFSEIEAFPCAVLKHHWPAVPNLGDMTKFKEWPNESIDLLVGGTPCQSFSVAGLRKGLDDPRGNLMLTFLAIADRFRPRWVVWENVPGVLSSGEGRDFGCFLGGLGELGYGFAYRVLDARYFGVPQRRRRVFVVGHLGDWRRAAAVLFERACLQGNPPPSREAGKGTPSSVARSLRGRSNASHREDSDTYVPHIAEVATTLDAHYGTKMGLENQHINGGGRSSLPDVSLCLNAGGMGRLDSETETLIPTGGGFDVAPSLVSNGDAHSGFRDANGLVAHSLRAEGHDASEDGTGRGTPLVVNARQDPCCNVNVSEQLGAKDTGHAVAFGISSDALDRSGEGKAGDAASRSGLGIHKNVSPTVKAAHPNAVAFQEAQTGCREYTEAGTLRANGPGHDPVGTRVRQGMSVRRLTPRECERLQGFPDDYTLVPFRKKPACDGPRYKALGNSMAVPVMAWIGQRIKMVNEIPSVGLGDMKTEKENA